MSKGCKINSFFDYNSFLNFCVLIGYFYLVFILSILLFDSFFLVLISVFISLQSMYFIFTRKVHTFVFTNAQSFCPSRVLLIFLANIRIACMVNKKNLIAFFRFLINRGYTLFKFLRACKK